MVSAEDRILDAGYEDVVIFKDEGRWHNIRRSYGMD